MKRYKEYKDSGIEWIGEIPSEWEVKKLKYFTSINDGVLPEMTPSNYTFRYIDIGSVTLQEGIKQYQEMDFENAPSRARRIVKRGDVIVSTVRTYLKAVTNIEDDSDVIASTGFAVVRPRNINSKFLGYALINHYFVETVSSLSTGVSYPAINASVMMNIKNVLPSLDAQKNIVVYLDHKTSGIEALIADKQKLIDLLKEKRQVLISEAVTKGIDPTVPMQDSGIEWIGEIPSQWSVSKIGYHYNTQLGKMLQPNQSQETDTLGKYLCAANIKNNGISVEPQKEMWFSEIDKSTYEVSRGDLLVVEGGDVGVSVIYDLDEKTYIQNALHRVRSGIFSLNKYLWYWLGYLKVRGYMDLVCNKATIAHYTKDKLINTPIIMPPLHDQQNIVDYLNLKTAQIDSLVVDISEQIEKLKEYRQSIISEVVTGKVAI